MVCPRAWTPVSVLPAPITVTVCSVTARIDASNVRRLVIVAFEAEMNVVMYANSGIITFILTDDEIKLKIADEGPGIPDIDLALQEGYSTASDEMREMGFGFGMGLPNMRKNSDEFHIKSEVGKGTTVCATIRHNANA